jgi:hypothetical protein
MEKNQSASAPPKEEVVPTAEMIQDPTAGGDDLIDGRGGKVREEEEE